MIMKATINSIGQGSRRPSAVVLGIPNSDSSSRTVPSAESHRRYSNVEIVSRKGIAESR